MQRALARRVSPILAATVLCAAGSSASGSDETQRVLVADEPPFYPGTQGAITPPRDPSRPSYKGREGSSHRPYHPAPGIVVDVVDESGTVLPGLQRSARNLGYWPFRHCYEEGLRRDQSLTGTVSLDLLLSPETTGRRTELESSTVKDGIVTACVAREAHHLVFDPVASPVAAKLRVLLALGDEPVPLALGFPGGTDLRATLRTHWGEAASCFEASLARHPDAGGRIELRFDLDDDGTTSKVSQAGVRYPDTETANCVEAVYRKAALTSPPAVRGKSFVYVVHFEPASSVLPVPR
jgi:hypothetical protein